MTAFEKAATEASTRRRISPEEKFRIVMLLAADVFTCIVAADEEELARAKEIEAGVIRVRDNFVRQMKERQAPKDAAKAT